MSEAMQYAFRALAQRALSEHELRSRLSKRGVSDDEAQQVIERLKDYGYLDDTALARNATQKRGVGGLRVRAELTRRGVDRTVVEEALASRDPSQEEQEVTSLVERHQDRWMRARDPRAKAFGFLARRGFPPSVIWPAIAHLGRDEET